VSKRYSASLFLAAFALAACPAPTATTLAAKQAKVDQLTGALSLQNNDHLKQAADSLGQVNTNLNTPGFKRAEGAVGNIVAQGGGNIVATGGGNIISTNGGGIISTNGGGIISTNGGGLVALGRAVASLGLPLPGLAATGFKLAQAADVQVVADPATGELQRVFNANASLGFKYTPNGNRRQELITLDGLPDGTSGSLLLDLTAASWHASTPPADASFDGYEGGGTTTDDGYQDGYQDGYTPYHIAQAAGITFMGNEAPNDPQRVALALKLLPKGTAANQLSANVTLDEVKSLGGGAPTATHMAFDVAIPSLSLDGDLRLAAEGVGSMKGNFGLETKPGAKEAFTYVLTLDNPHGQASLQLDHPASQVRLKATTTSGTTSMGLYAMEDNSKIADVAPTAGEPGVITLKYVDGTVKRWAPFSGAPATTVSGPPGSPKPTPAASFPAHF
jgi:hypothetical protein